MLSLGKSIIDNNDWDSMGNVEWDGVSDNNACYIWTANPNTVNCKVGYCFSSPGGVRVGGLPLLWAVVEAGCRRFNAGGWHRGYTGQAEVFNEPGAVVPPPSKREIDGDEQPEVIQIELSREDYDYYMNNTHVETEEIVKRQDPSFILTFSAFGVAKPNNRDQVTPRLPAGSSWTYQTSEGFSHSVATSVGVDVGLFEIFTASVSITTTLETSYDVTSGVTVLVDCAQGQNGVIYYEPLYDYYEGYYSSSNDRIDDFWIPRGRGGASDGQFVSECLG